jgi:hypothetical protein
MFNLTWSPGVTLEQIERHAIEQAYKFYQGNKVQTARALDIAVRTLETKLEKYRNDDARTTASVEEQRKRDSDFQRRQRGLPPLDSGIDTGEARFDRPLGATAGEGHAVEETGSGIRVESAPDATEKHAVPVQVGKKIQGVSPTQAASGSSRKAR